MKCVWDIKFLSPIQPWKHFTRCLKHKFFEVELCDTLESPWMVPSPAYISTQRRLNLLGFSGYPTFYNHNQPLVLPTNHQSTTNLKGYPSIASAGLCQAWCLGTLWFTLRREQCQLGTWTFARTGGRGKSLFFLEGLTKVPCQLRGFLEVNLEPLKWSQGHLKQRNTWVSTGLPPGEPSSRAKSSK